MSMCIHIRESNVTRVAWKHIEIHYKPRMVTNGLFFKEKKVGKKGPYLQARNCGV